VFVKGLSGKPFSAGKNHREGKKMAAVEKKPESSPIDEMRRQIDPAVLDFEHLGRYTGGNTELEVELLGLFQRQAREQFETLVHVDRLDDWKMAIHTLKGAARSIGAMTVAELSCKVEDAGFDCSDDEKIVHMNALNRELTICLMNITLFVDAAALG
jgi:hypothetical protein